MLFNRQIKDLQLHKEKMRNGAYLYYLSAVCEYEDEAGVYETIIPKIILPVCSHIIQHNIEDLRMFKPHHSINLGFGMLDLESSVVDNYGNECLYKDIKIKDKTKKMTLAEIEKKLGHKIELVNEK